MGYEVITYNREYCKIASGGVTLAVKHKYVQYIKLLKGVRRNTIWFEISNKLLNANNLFGFVYTSPEYSTYSSVKLFVELSEDLLLLNPGQNKCIYLC